MAIGHFSYNKGTAAGALLFSSLRDIEEGRDNLSRIVAAFIQMKDSGVITVYAADQFGFEDDTAATSALAELESVKGALDGIAATLNQAFAKFRNG